MDIFVDIHIHGKPVDTRVRMQLLHGVEHGTQEKIHIRQEKSIHPQRLYN